MSFTIEAYPVALMQPFKLDVFKEANHGGPLVARLEGKLALETVSPFLQSMRQEQAPSLILDLAGVPYIDSAGVGALVQLFVHRKSQGQKFAVAALTTQGRAVMEVSGLVKLLPIFDSVDQAQAANA